MIYAVAQQIAARSDDERVWPVLTIGKRYEVLIEDCNCFDIIDDEGQQIPCYWVGCAFARWVREDDRRETPDLRDQFSMAALTGLMAAEAPDVIYESEGVARRAYRIADAMLVARAEGGAA